MRYFLLRRQIGGCDYTIGCGISFEELSAKTREEARLEITGLHTGWQEKVRQMPVDKEDYIHDNLICETYLKDIAPDNEQKISEMFLYEVAEEIDCLPLLESAYAEIEQFKKELDVEEHERRERLQYQRLKAKYGDT